uniref:NADH-ubiquinone oxidoreductase chain 2 n=1 Tax=Prionospio fallax TaxID=3050094 RepID=A0AAU6QH05_9ANNE
MFLYPYMNLFIMSLLTSTIMALSSSHWLMIWMSLEINMISFIPLISSSSWGQEPEAALKYLLFQALGSSFILLSSLHSGLSLSALLGLCIKLGLAPTHYWFPSVMKSLNWLSAVVLMTWQKLAPMILLISLFSAYKSILCFYGLISVLIGGVGGFSQSHMRPLLAYSSIGHMGWIISTASFALPMSIFYFFIYVIISIALISNAAFSNISSIFQSSKPIFPSLIILVIPCTLSLAGLPPFLGFFPKLFAIQSFSSTLMPLFLLLGSILNLSYYLNFFFCLFLSSNKSFWPHMTASPTYTPFITMVSVSPLPLLFLLTLMF